MSLLLGPFRLQKIIGKGGMGVIWRGEHTRQRVPVALKIDLHPPDEAAIASFLHEVRIIAGLDHRNVVLLLDQGVVDATAQEASGGELRRGSRWLAMELAQGGSVADHPPKNWRELLHVARGLLDALSHAHARGVVHRDIKPGNILLAGSDEGVTTVPSNLLDARVVLSDFGISDRSDLVSAHTDQSVGTPHYMAPEQIEAHWRDQGPWTDLYAVGILLWRLTTGSHCFAGTNAFQIYRQHLMSPPGPFVPRFGVPEGFEQILHKLLQKAPLDRYAFASHVRRDLDALGASSGTSWEMPAVEEDATVVAQTTQPVTRRRTRGALQSPLPRNFQLRSAGLSLFGMRTPPLVGREELCDQLWGELVKVRSTGAARVVILRGTMGTGKTRLSAWVAQRAHETGVADMLTARHSPEQGPSDGLTAMFRSALKTDGLSAEELAERLKKLFGETSIDRSALASLLSPGLVERQALGRREKRLLLLQVLLGMRPGGCWVLRLEDAHHDVETLEFVDHLLAVQSFRPSPVLVVLTIRNEDLVDTSEAADLLEELVEDPRCSSHAVGPLTTDAQQRLVRALVGLDGAVVQQLEERTAGNPLFAVQLLEAWVEQGVLEPGPRGFRLQRGALDAVPADLVSLWESRLEAVLEGRSDEDALALEMAAAMGHAVDTSAWDDCIELLEIEPRADLFSVLQRRSLVSTEEGTRGRWRFVHGLLREILVRRAKEHGRWEDVCLAAAVQMQEVGIEDPKRLAGYLLEAHVFEQALEPIVEAISDQLDVGDLRDDTFFHQMERVLNELELPEDSPWRGRLQLLRASRERLRGDYEAAEQSALSVIRDAERYGWELELSRAYREASRVLYSRGNLERALTFGRKAEARFAAAGDTFREGDSASTVGEILSSMGRFDASRARFLHALKLLNTPRGKQILHTVLFGLVLVEQRAGHIEQTLVWLKRCRDHCEPRGMQYTLASCANIEGELARAQGELERAAECYREASERYQALESPGWVYPVLNLGIMDINAGRYEAAFQRMISLLAYCRRSPQATIEAYTHMVLMAAAAGEGDRERSEDSLSRLRSHVGQTSMVDADIASMAEKTGILWSAAGDQELAVPALRLAISQYRALGREREASRLERRLL